MVSFGTKSTLFLLRANLERRPFCAFVGNRLVDVWLAGSTVKRRAAATVSQLSLFSSHHKPVLSPVLYSLHDDSSLLHTRKKIARDLRDAVEPSRVA